MTGKPDEPTRLTVDVHGIVLPSWVGVTLILTSSLAVLALLLVMFYCRDLAREIRILQLHVQDLEAVEIRSGNATRDDFADWGEAPLRTRPPSREKEE